jgi:serine-type D-Ala-D-Ala carboxypeptidase (penicillin-binding protein 5/6)
MKLFKSLIFVLLLLLITGVAVLSLRKNDPNRLISPVLGISQGKFADNIWFPNTATPSSSLDPLPDLTSNAVFAVEINTGQVLYSKNAKQRLPVASLMKIMTAIIALERKNLTDEYLVSKRAADMEPDKMFLIAGERLTLEELLSGVFLVSANDAAEVIAEGTTGIREEFISLMNTKAISLGMNDTLFINPSGLEEDDPEKGEGVLKPHYSTAYDVALMSRYLIRRWPEVIKITSSDHIFLPKTEKHQDYDMYSGINLLTTYEGVLGLKTGFTPEAGLTLVSLARREDKEMIVVLLGSESRREDAKLLLDYSFGKLDPI